MSLSPQPPYSRRVRPPTASVQRWIICGKRSVSWLQAAGQLHGNQTRRSTRWAALAQCTGGPTARGPQTRPSSALAARARGASSACSATGGAWPPGLPSGTSARSARCTRTLRCAAATSTTATSRRERGCDTPPLPSLLLLSVTSAAQLFRRRQSTDGHGHRAATTAFPSSALAGCRTRCYSVPLRLALCLSCCGWGARSTRSAGLCRRDIAEV